MSPYEWSEGERSRVEESGTAFGLDFAVIVSSLGHRCGYVRVPESHPWHGAHYNHRADGAPTDEDDFDWDARIDAKVTVHGGLTFSDKTVHKDLPSGWWFGFDCAHAGDGRDPDLAHESMKQYAAFEGGIVRSRTYVRDECASLAKQFVAIQFESGARS